MEPGEGIEDRLGGSEGEAADLVVFGPAGDDVELDSVAGFFFQAEDGIRDGHVTGVQTCALPIYFNASRFLQMVGERGGLSTARYLLHAPGLSDGFTALWECDRLDLTVEAYVLKQIGRASCREKV